MKKVFLITIAIIGIAMFLMVVSIPFVDNYIAYSIKRDLIKLPLPDRTERADAVSMAGKLTGNGNGMQFFGAILIKSDLTEEELNQYYSKYRQDEWSCIVERQISNRVNVVENRDLIFKALKPDETLTDYYIVYTWGSSSYSLSDLDLRGH